MKLWTYSRRYFYWAKIIYKSKTVFVLVYATDALLQSKKFGV